MIKMVLTIIQILLCAVIILLGFKNRDNTNMVVGACLMILSVI